MASGTSPTAGVGWVEGGAGVVAALKEEPHAETDTRAQRTALDETTVGHMGTYQPVAWASILLNERPACHSQASVGGRLPGECLREAAVHRDEVAGREAKPVARHQDGQVGDGLRRNQARTHQIPLPVGLELLGLAHSPGRRPLAHEASEER